jgi:phenylalanine-4-hydroxylase
MQQQYSNYSAQDFQVWKTLFDRQIDQLQELASESYLNCVNELSELLCADAIPEFTSLNKFLTEREGWEIEVVPGHVEVSRFFQLLFDKRFCSSTWLRKPEQLDYLEEPDMFHDIFGHIPLLIDPVYSRSMHKMARLAIRFGHSEEVIQALRSLYWFTIEFGLIYEQGGVKIYGAGVLSSFGETQTLFKRPEVKLHDFDWRKLLDTPFRTDQIQNDYFVIESLEQLESAVDEIGADFERRFSLQDLTII